MAFFQLGVTFLSVAWSDCAGGSGGARAACLSWATHSPQEVLDNVCLYSFFYRKSYTYAITVVFEVVEESLYAVFFGFTKLIKRLSE